MDDPGVKSALFFFKVAPFVWAALHIAAGGFCAFLAREKRRDPVPWFLLGVAFGLIALIGIAAAGEIATAEDAQEDGG